MTAPEDQLDWDRERDGRMADAATAPEDEPQTVPYDPAGDDARAR